MVGKKALIPENEKLLAEFSNALIHLSRKRRKGIIAEVREFSRELGRPIDKAAKEDVLKALGALGGRLRRNSFRIYVTSVRQYYKFIGRKDVVEAIKLPRSSKAKPVYPSGEEFIRIINACHHPRDRCLLVTGYETATAGRARKELLNIRLGDITIKNNVAYIDIPESKTEARRVMVKKFIQDFRLWLNLHPLKDQSDAPLFVTEFNSRRQRNVVKADYSEDGRYVTVHYQNKRHRRFRIFRDSVGREYKKLSYQAARDVMAKACRRAGTKPYTLRSLRHRRSKDLEHILPLREKMAYFGWSNVGTALIYGSFTSEEACETIAAVEDGRPVRRVEEEMENWVCPACKTSNPPTHNFCGVCTQPRDERIAVKRVPHNIDEFVDEVLKRLLVLLQDKQIGQRALEIIAQETEAVA